MIIYTIYRITCRINGKIYIGFTSKSIIERLYYHVYNATKHTQLSDTILHRAIRKYGPEQFDIEALYCSRDRAHTHKVMEPCFIQELGSHVKHKLGYNSTAGGDGVPDLSAKGRGRMGAYQLRRRQFISPEGLVYTVDKLAKFCHEHKLCRGRMADVWDGKQNASKGWRAYPLRPVKPVNKGGRPRITLFPHCGF